MSFASRRWMLSIQGPEQSLLPVWCSPTPKEPMTSPSSTSVIFVSLPWYTIVHVAHIIHLLQPDQNSAVRLSELQTRNAGVIPGWAYDFKEHAKSDGSPATACGTPPTATSQPERQLPINTSFPILPPLPIPPSTSRHVVSSPRPPPQPYPHKPSPPLHTSSAAPISSSNPVRRTRPSLQNHSGPDQKLLIRC